MRKLTFSIGLILLIAFSVFSPLQILKIETANAEVQVPKTYVQTVNDPYINHTDAWENFTTGLDPDSYSLIQEGNEGYEFDWTTKSLGTSYNWLAPGNDTQWWLKNLSTNHDTVLICLGDGDPSYLMVYPWRWQWEDFTDNLTVCTPKYTIVYDNSTIPAPDGYSWIVPLANALRNIGYSHVYLLGYDSGAMCVASYLCYYDTGTVFDGAIICSGFLNQTDPLTQSSTWSLANIADGIKTKTAIIEGSNDYDASKGNGTVQAFQFYNNMTVSEKELHIFTDGHYVFGETEVSTGRSYEIVVEEFIKAHESNESGLFTAYCKREGCDEWGDAIARQGYYPHGASYCLDWNNKKIKPMLSYPYIPVDVGNDEIILQMTAKHSAPTWYGNWPAPWGRKSPWPTIGATIMLFFNVYAHDNINNVDKWLFNFHEPNPWAGPNMFILEIFMSRWIVADPILAPFFASMPPGFPYFEQFYSITTHDNDLHLVTCPFEMPINDQWYYFLYDVGNKMQDCADKIEIWSMGSNYMPVYEVLGFQLMTIAMGVETIGGSWTFQFGDISLTDFRWGTGSAFTNSQSMQLKTRADGLQYIPLLKSVNGYPNPIRPYMTYTNDTLDSDITDDGHVNIFDAIRLGNKFGSRELVYSAPPRNWDYSCDIVKDGHVNILDSIRLADVFGSSPTMGNYSTGLGTIYVWMEELAQYGGGYWPDPPPGYSGPPWIIPRTVPYTAHYYLEMWDVLNWPSHESASINYMGKAVFYNGTTLNQTGICLYAYDYPIHD